MRIAVLAVVPQLASAQPRPAPPAPARSAPIADVRYAVSFTAASAVERALDVSLRFTVSGREPVLLALPVWTPGAYEVANFARNVSRFAATSRGTPLRWEKSAPQTWRIFPASSGEVLVSFRYRADSLDNAGSWTRDDFALFNGTNLFLYPAGQSLDFSATVTLETEPTWRVVTGMHATGARSWSAPSYHELVDHPFFVGRFDIDSALVDGVWFRLSSYPAGSVGPARRMKLFGQLARAVPTQTAVFRDHPWTRYELMQVADSGFGGMSALEHENSNVAVVGAEQLDEEFLPSVYAHEIFHAFNVKRLRPSDLWPYRYDIVPPTPWLWVSEGITDYYADLSLVRGGVTSEAGFLSAVQKKMGHVNQTAPVALVDASLQATLGMRDGTADIYYDKGSLAGLALDLLIRDASDNAASLDDVLRSLYSTAYRAGRGFTADEWWSAVSGAANGADLRSTFGSEFVAGRVPYRWPDWLAKAGWRLRSDTLREPRLGVSLRPDSTGMRVAVVDPEGVAAAAGIRGGDLLVAVDGVATVDPTWEGWRQRFAKREGAPLPLTVVRNGRSLDLTATVRFAVLIDERLEADPAATEKARRIRDGILRGRAAP